MSNSLECPWQHNSSKAVSEIPSAIRSPSSTNLVQVLKKPIILSSTSSPSISVDRSLHVEPS